MTKKIKKSKTAMIFFAIIAVFCLIGFVWHRYFWFDLQYDEHISVCCNDFCVSKDLVYAVIKAESNFNANATSNKGAQGLMQLMPSTATFVANMLGDESFDLTDPKQNIRFGICYLAYLQTKFDSQIYVVAAYNAGENNVKRWIESGEDIPFDETKNYIKRVEFFQKVYNALYK